MGNRAKTGTLPAYSSETGPSVREITGELKRRRPNPWLTGVLVIMSAVLPPLGVIVTLASALARNWRQATLPFLMATLAGGALWGWGIWLDTRSNMYRTPYEALLMFIDAENWALESQGNYLPLVELKIKGFLPPEFPVTGYVEFEFVEHVVGPTGYLVEVRPGNVESAVYGMKSLWSDHTGDIRLGGMDGPVFKP